jgi:tetratricopeptide (TPR) repeat protein
MDEKTKTSVSEAFSAYKSKDFKSAAALFQECIEFYDHANDGVNAAEMRNNLSVVLLELKDPEKALHVLANTDLIFEKLGDSRRQAMALGNMAAATQALGHNDEALALFERSAEVFKLSGDKELRSITLKKIADLQLKTKKQFQAMASLQAAYDQKEKSTVKDNVLKGFLASLVNKITRRS